MLVNVTVLAHTRVGSLIGLYSIVQLLRSRSGSRIQSSTSVHEQRLPLLQGEGITWEEARSCGKEDQYLDLGNETSANTKSICPAPGLKRRSATE